MRIVSDVDHVMVVDDAIDPSFCQELIDRFEADQRKTQGKQYSDDSDERQGVTLQLSRLAEWFDADKRLYDVVTAAAQLYMQRYSIQTQAIDNGYAITRFDPGDYSKPHVDSIDKLSAFRLVTVICYLNDVEEGGETYFIHRDQAIKPKRGRILMFPPFFTHPHASAPAKQQRYLMITWISSDPRLVGVKMEA